MGALEGIKVLELAQIFAGPGTGMYLADHGAEVIKVEPPQGDQCRYFATGAKTYAVLNRNKRAIALDITKPQGQEIVYQLVGWADVFIHNFRPGVAERLGYDYPTLSRLNPGLIYAWISGWGEKGPYADKPAYDRLIQGMAGLMASNRRPDGYPAQLPLWPADCAMPMLVGFGIMAALWQRQKTGRGQMVTTSLLQAAIAMQSVQLVLAEGESSIEEGAQPTYHTYQCQDGAWINICILNEKEWVNLCRVLEIEHLTTDSRFASIKKRAAHAEELYPLLEELFHWKTSQEWIPLLLEGGVPAAPIISRDEVLQEPQIVANAMLATQEHPELGKVTMINTPVRLSAAPASIRTPAPALGEHTEAVLRELGYSAAAISRLAAEKVVVLPQKAASRG